MISLLAETYLIEKEAFFICLHEHLLLTVETLVVAVLLGVPMGVLCAKVRIANFFVQNTLNVINQIPTIAFFILLMPFLGIGHKPALLAMCIYALMVVVVNTQLGINTINQTIIESAESVGMNKLQIFFKIELPLALPKIVSGFRLATIQTIAGATIASYVGAGSLGVFIMRGISRGLASRGTLLLGAVSIAALTCAADLVFYSLQKYVNKRFAA